MDRREWVGSLREATHGVLTDLAWHLIIAEDARGEVVGLVSGSYVGNTNVGVIGYLAITADQRSRGLGSRLRGRLRRAFSRDALRVASKPLAAIIGEVSESNRWLRTLNARDEVLVLDLPYYQPSLREDDEPSPFRLYYESMGAPVKRLSAATLRQILYSIWRRVYRIPRPLDRPAFRLMMTALEGRRTIGALKATAAPTSPRPRARVPRSTRKPT